MCQTCTRDNLLKLAADMISIIINSNVMAALYKLPCSTEPCNTTADNGYFFAGFLFWQINFSIY